MPSVRLIRPQYTISFFIGEIDLTMRVNSVSIINSIKTIYPVFFIKINISSKDYFLEKIYGQKDARLKIVVTSESSIPLETTDIELVIVHNNNKVSSQVAEGSKESNQMEDEMHIIALHKNAFLTMSKTVNLVSNTKTGGGGLGSIIGGGNPLGGILDSILGGGGFNLDSINNILHNPLTDVFEQIFGNKDTWSKSSKPIARSSNFVAGNNPLDDIIADFTNFGIDDFLGFLNNGGNQILPKPIRDAINTLTNNTGGGGLGQGGGDSTPIALVKKIVKKYINNTGVNIKSNNANKVKLGDIVIPPISFISAIRYINDRYGVYKGPMHVYYDIEDKFNMWDISSATSSLDVDYTVELLARGLSDVETMKKSVSNDNHFYTTNPIKVQNKTNNTIMNRGFEHIFVKNPRNKFFETVSTDMNSVLKDVSISENPELIFNEVGKKQVKVHSIGVMGSSDDKENAFMTSKLAQYISTASMFKYKLKGTKIPLKKLFRVGGVMKFVPRVSEYLKFSGKYIVGSTVITLTRESTGSYVCYVEGTCFRESIEN